MTSNPPRVAICGIDLESNAFSPPASEADFRNLCYLEGDEILADARGAAPRCIADVVGFVSTMDATGPWEPVPLVYTHCHPWGPADQDFFDRVVAQIADGIAANRVDAVFVANHGAMLTTGSMDPDGDFLERLRDTVGPDIPVVVTLDLHANVSARMAEAADILIAYQTNPHVDMFERGEEAAHVVRTILGGNAHPQSAFIKLPLAPPSTTLLTREGPYADLIDYGLRRKRELGGAILNVSVVGGFVFSDTPRAGLSIAVTGRHELEPAQRLAREIAELAWADRARFQRPLTPLADAVESAVERGSNAALPPLIYSDAGDNPGGGGGGDTMELLSALTAANARGVLYGSVYDPTLAAEAIQHGVGAEFTAVFNREPATRFSARFEIPVRVSATSTEPFVGRLGLFNGMLLNTAPSCALEIGGPGGITVVVISNRYQTADPMFFEHLGLDIGLARTVCVKSRGHFRAGFEPWFPPKQVQEVDTAGFTSPDLSRFDWTGLPRPVYPLDKDAEWVPPNW
ncbi:MAG: MlrC family protein 3 [Alphaproteobacteria bacterium]|nr:MlrC family protein 3 [Alphaproteobacteria bacterium]